MLTILPSLPHRIVLLSLILPLSLLSQSLHVPLANFSNGADQKLMQYATQDQPALVLAPRYKVGRQRMVEKLLLITPRLRVAYQDQMSFPLRGPGSIDSVHYHTALNGKNRLIGFDSSGYLCVLQNFSYPLRLSKSPLPGYYHRRPLAVYSHPANHQIYTALRKNYNPQGGAYRMHFYQSTDSSFQTHFTDFDLATAEARHYPAQKALIPVVANSDVSDSLAVGYFNSTGQFVELFKQRFEPGTTLDRWGCNCKVKAPLPQAVAFRQNQAWLGIDNKVYYANKFTGHIDSTLKLEPKRHLPAGSLSTKLQFLGDTIAITGRVKTDTQSNWNATEAFFMLYNPGGKLLYDSIFDYFPHSNTSLQGIIPAGNGRYYLTGFSNERIKGNHFFMVKWPLRRVSLSENAAGGALLKLYPNPTSSNVQVSLSQPATLQLLTQQGKIVETKTRSAGTHEWVMNHLPKGLYLLKATTEGGGSQIKKLVLN